MLLLAGRSPQHRVLKCYLHGDNTYTPFCSLDQINARLVRVNRPLDISALEFYSYHYETDFGFSLYNKVLLYSSSSQTAVTSEPHCIFMSLPNTSILLVLPSEYPHSTILPDSLYPSLSYLGKDASGCSVPTLAFHKSSKSTIPPVKSPPGSRLTKKNVPVPPHCWSSRTQTHLHCSPVLTPQLPQP